MAASQNNLSVTVRQQDSTGADVLGTTGRTFAFTYAGVNGDYWESLNVPLAGIAVVLPVSPILQLFIKNLDATNYLIVTWTVGGGASQISKNVRPGGFIAFSDQDTSATAGITALNITPNTAAVKVQMFLGG